MLKVWSWFWYKLSFHAAGLCLMRIIHWLTRNRIKIYCVFFQHNFWRKTLKAAECFLHFSQNRFFRRPEASYGRQTNTSICDRCLLNVTLHFNAECLRVVWRRQTVQTGFIIWYHSEGNKIKPTRSSFTNKTSQILSPINMYTYLCSSTFLHIFIKRKWFWSTWSYYFIKLKKQWF